MAEWFVPRPWVVALTPVNRKFVVIFWTTTAMERLIFWMTIAIAWTGKPVIVARVLESVNMVPRPVRTATGANVSELSIRWNRKLAMARTMTVTANQLLMK